MASAHSKKTKQTSKLILSARVMVVFIEVVVITKLSYQGPGSDPFPLIFAAVVDLPSIKHRFNLLTAKIIIGHDVTRIPDLMGDSAAKICYLGAWCRT